MEVIEWTINYKSKNAELNFYPFGDLHGGAIECAEHDASRYLTRCQDDPFGYLLGKGDYSDCITKNDPRFDVRNVATWVEKDNIVESQRKHIVDLLKPLAEQRKIIGLLTGNHEEEIHKRHDNDITRNICKDLGVSYGGYQCFVILRFIRGRTGGHQVYVWHAWHGAGGAQTEGARVMRLMRLVNDIEADIYTMGHLHGAVTVYTPDRLVYNLQSHKIRSVKVVACLSGSWIKGFMQSTEAFPLNPYYGEVHGFKPARIGAPIIKIRPYWHDIAVEV